MCVDDFDMADKVRDINQYNLLKSKYGGLGNVDTTGEQFISNMKRDSYGSFIQHKNLLLYNSIILNDPVPNQRIRLIKQMVNPGDTPKVNK